MFNNFPNFINLKGSSEFTILAKFNGHPRGTNVSQLDALTSREIEHADTVDN